MKISHRLYLTVLPSILAVCLVAGLWYWGERGRQLPTLVLVVAILAVLASVGLTWSNARYVAGRIGRLASASTPRSAPAAASRAESGEESPRPTNVSDEIGTIEREVQRLEHALESAERRRSGHEQRAERRTREYATLLARVSDDLARMLDEVRLPLHILLENHFGDLNENQEEMLGAARAAVEVVHANVASLRRIADIDLGRLDRRSDPLKPAELFGSLRPMLVAAGQEHDVTLRVDVAPLLPTILGDRALLQEALVTLLREPVMAAAPGAAVHLDVTHSDHTVNVTLRGAGSVPDSAGVGAATRVIEAHGGDVELTPGALTIQLPSLGRDRVRDTG